jgi:hypothetical protein
MGAAELRPYKGKEGRLAGSFGWLQGGNAVGAFPSTTLRTGGMRLFGALETLLFGFLGKSRLLSSAGDGAVDVHDDGGVLFVLGMEFAIDGGEGAEKQLAGVGHDSGATGSDLIVGKKFVEFAEGAVDGDGGGEFDGIADEPCGDVGGVAGVFELRSVLEAKTSGGVGGEFAATALAHAVLTAGEFADRNGVRCFWSCGVVHFVFSIFGRGEKPPTRQFL